MATFNQKAVFDKVVDKARKGAKVSVSKEMHPPYSKRYAEHPDRLKKSKGWKELMDKYLPDDLLAKKHKELLTVPIKVKKYIKGELETDYELLDTFAVSKGLDMGYKLKGKYQAEKIEHSGGIDQTIKVDEKTKELVDGFVQYLKKTK